MNTMKETTSDVKTGKRTVSGQKKTKKKSVSKVLNTIINVVLIVAIIVAAICTYISFVASSGSGVPGFLGLRLLSIQTDSMEPAIKPGDLVISVDIKDPSKLRPGDVITYWTIINSEQALNTHRIKSIYDGGDFLIFETQGDNNPTADPLTVHESKLVGQYKWRIPGLGKVFDYLQTPTGFLVVVVIPVFVFFLFQRHNVF